MKLKNIYYPGSWHGPAD